MASESSRSEEPGAVDVNASREPILPYVLNLFPGVFGIYGLGYFAKRETGIGIACVVLSLLLIGLLWMGILSSAGLEGIGLIVLLFMGQMLLWVSTSVGAAIQLARARRWSIGSVAIVGGFVGSAIALPMAWAQMVVLGESVPPFSLAGAVIVLLPLSCAPAVVVLLATKAPETYRHHRSWTSVFAFLGPLVGLQGLSHMLQGPRLRGFIELVVGLGLLVSTWAMVDANGWDPGNVHRLLLTWPVGAYMGLWALSMSGARLDASAVPDQVERATSISPDTNA